MTDASPMIVLAAGGTGGHIFPAEALARELLGRGCRVALMTDQRGSMFSDELSVPVYRIRAKSLGSGIVKKVLSVLEMGIGVLQAYKHLCRLKPSVVVGFGGYPSVPTLFAASRRGIPILLHEQNAVLGRANMVLMGKAAIVATSFSQVSGLEISRNARQVFTGNPVRPAFMALRGKPYPSLATEGQIKILVLGGSLGAHVFSHVVPRALALMPETLRRRVAIAQQCRKEDIESARSAFAAIGVDAELATFFHDVPERMADAHLVISRSGGSTIAELTVVGRPAVLVPYTRGHAGEQTANASAIAEVGGAWLIPEDAFTPEALFIRLESLMTLPNLLAKTAAASRAWGKVGAVDLLADAVISLVSTTDIHSR